MYISKRTYRNKPLNRSQAYRIVKAAAGKKTQDIAPLLYPVFLN
ncbi:hypothetical protein EUR_04900 [Agathobacter rectalis DSM 17629]|nr:hypothetical protein EUR_04900 [Agathobacter rectalis DSM 17629]